MNEWMNESISYEGDNYIFQLYEKIQSFTLIFSEGILCVCVCALKVFFI